MSITLEIIEQGHVLLYTFTDPWQVNDLTKLYSQANDHIIRAKHAVHSVADLRASKVLVPQGVMRARSGGNFAHPNNGYIVVVGALGLARQIAELVFLVANFDRIKFFDDMDGALHFLRAASEREVIDEAIAQS